MASASNSTVNLWLAGHLTGLGRSGVRRLIARGILAPGPTYDRALCQKIGEIRAALVKTGLKKVPGDRLDAALVEAGIERRQR